MRLGSAALVAAALLIGAAPTLAITAAGPRFGVYTANVGIAAAGHLEASIHVNDPPTTLETTFACSRPTGRETVTVVLDTPVFPLHDGSFSFDRAASLKRITTLTENNALVGQSAYKGTADVNGAFSAHGQFVGTVRLDGSPCNGTSYTASRLAGPALDGQP